MKKTLFIVFTICLALCTALSMVGCSGGNEPCTHANVGDWIVDKTATCTVLGEKHKECTDCGEMIEQEKLLADHNFVSGICSVCKCKQGTAGLEIVKVDGKDEYAVKGIGTATETEIVIPTSYSNLPVTTILKDAFKGTSIESVEIQDSIVSIGESAFENCASLSDLVFGRNSALSEIGKNAFKGCVAFSSLELCPSVQTLGEGAFNGCVGLYEISFGSDSKLENIESKAFEGCVMLQSIEIPSTLKKVGGYAFNGCVKLEEIELPSGVMVVEAYAFFGCTKLTAYCGIVEIEKPSGWDSKWLDLDLEGNRISVDWNTFQK